MRRLSTPCIRLYLLVQSGLPVRFCWMHLKSQQILVVSQSIDYIRIFHLTVLMVPSTISQTCGSVASRADQEREVGFVIGLPEYVALRLRSSIHHPLNLIERHRIVAPVVEARGAGRFVAGHLLGHFELTAILEVGGDARGAEAVAGDSCCNAGGLRAALDHGVNILLGKLCATGELAVPERWEEGSSWNRSQT